MLKRQAIMKVGSSIANSGAKYSAPASRSLVWGALLAASVSVVFASSLSALAQTVQEPAVDQPAAITPAAPEPAAVSPALPAEAGSGANVTEPAASSSSTVPEVQAQGAAAPVENPVAPDAAAPVATASAVDSQTQMPTGSCFTPPAGVLPSEVDAFLADPQSVFAQGNGNALMTSNRVRALAGSDARTIDPLIALSKAVTGDRAASIGAGLGRAAFGCARVNPNYAAFIQTRVAERGAAPLMTAFVSASNDMQVAALGATGATGAAAAGLSGGGDAGPFSAGLGGDEVVPQTAPEFSFPTRPFLFVPPDNNNNNNNGCDRSVSPSCVN